MSTVPGQPPDPEGTDSSVAPPRITGARPAQDDPGDYSPAFAALALGLTAAALASLVLVVWVLVGR